MKAGTGSELIYHNNNSIIDQEQGHVQKIESGTLCSAKSLNEIKSADDCKAAATELGLLWTQSYRSKGDFPACFHDRSNNVWFNTHQNPGRTNLEKRHAAICRGNKKLKLPKVKFTSH